MYILSVNGGNYNEFRHFESVIVPVFVPVSELIQNIRDSGMLLTSFHMPTLAFSTIPAWCFLDFACLLLWLQLFWHGVGFFSHACSGFSNYSGMLLASFHMPTLTIPSISACSWLLFTCLLLRFHLFRHAISFFSHAYSGISSYSGMLLTSFRMPALAFPAILACSWLLFACLLWLLQLFRHAPGFFSR